MWFVVWCDAPAAADAAILKINYTQYSLHLRHFIDRARKYISPQFRAFFLYDFIFILCVRLFVCLCVVTIRLSAAGATQRILKCALNLHECICIFVRNSGVDRSENKLRNWRIFLQPNSIRRCGRLWMMHIHPHFTFALPTNPTNWLLFIINYFPKYRQIHFNGNESVRSPLILVRYFRPIPLSLSSFTFRSCCRYFIHENVDCDKRLANGDSASKQQPQIDISE